MKSNRSSLLNKSLFGLAGCGLFAVALGLSWLFVGSPTANETPSPFIETAGIDRTGPPSHQIYTLNHFEDEPPAETKTVTARLRRGSTLVKALAKVGINRGEAYDALQTLYEAKYLDPKRLRAGMPITAQTDLSGQLVSLSLTQTPGEALLVKRQNTGDYLPVKLSAQLKEQTYRIASTIETSLYQSILDEGGKDQQVADIAQIFAFDVDFQREIHPGDSFEIVYNAMVDERGRPVRGGQMIYAAINGKVIDKAYYQHTPSDDGVSDYFTQKGAAATRFLMKTPINGARLSSSFGRRRHPISGYTRLHKGTDFAAPTGTPIYAAGHGTVERASRYGGYGKYVRIRHANGYKTAYAHMSRYGPGVKKGKRVRQGDIIGYVGSTGASTGPHLHYEVMINGKHVNAMRLKLPTGRNLKGDLYTEFSKRRQEIDTMRDKLGADVSIPLPAAQVAAN
ncbi:MAG: M23 family metallopeptidase [Pseudomonadota bacterium]